MGRVPEPDNGRSVKINSGGFARFLDWSLKYAFVVHGLSAGLLLWLNHASRRMCRPRPPLYFETLDGAIN